MKKGIGVIILLSFISLIFVQSVFGGVFQSIISDKTYYKNGDTINVTADLNDSIYTVFGNFTDITNDNYLIKDVEGTGTAEWAAAEKYNGDFSAKIAALGGDFPKYSYVGTLSNALNIPLDNIANISFYYKIADDAVNVTNVDIFNTWPMYFRSGEQFNGGYFSPY